MIAPPTQPLMVAVPPPRTAPMYVAVRSGPRPAPSPERACAWCYHPLGEFPGTPEFWVGAWYHPDECLRAARLLADLEARKQRRCV